MECIHPEPRAYCKRNDGCRDCEEGSNSALIGLLSAITDAEERWGTWGVGVEIYGDGSGRLHRDSSPAIEFTTIDKCFELLSR